MYLFFDNSLFIYYTATMTGGLYMLDYGAGNIRSLVNAINHLGYQITFVQHPSDIAKAEVKDQALPFKTYL